jgi:hypothetical protein
MRIAEREAVHWDWRMLNEEVEWEEFCEGSQWTPEQIAQFTHNPK